MDRGRRALVLAPVGLLLAPVFTLSMLPLGCPGPSDVLDLDGRAVDPLGAAAGATVLVFVSPTCPISNRYAPELRRLHERFSPRGVAFFRVYAGPEDTRDAVAEHTREYAYPFPALRDPGQVLVRRSGATVTPEAALYRRGAELAYRGRIDDLFAAFGKERAEPTRRDLAEAIEAVLAGRRVAVPFTPSIGCTIPRRR